MHSEAESAGRISSSSEEIRPPRGKVSAYVREVANKVSVNPVPSLAAQSQAHVQAGVGKVSACSVSLPTALPFEPVLPVSQVPVIVIADSDEDQDEEAAQDTFNTSSLM